MPADLPTHARVVVIGGGVMGCSLAYHLTKIGWTDVVVLERKRLTSGTTWHAAGLVGQLRATFNLTRLAKYTADLYAKLEAETGQATGLRRCGSLAVAADAERFEEFRRGASMARRCGLDVEVVGAAEIRRLWPLINADDIVGGVHLPGDGQINPVDVTLALAKGARMGGTRFFEDTRVTAIHRRDGRVAAVATDRGEIACEVVVNCAGLWGREVGRMAGVDVALQACEHFYIVTAPVPGLVPGTPVLRDPGGYCYFKEDAGKLLVGCFEPVAKPWGVDGIPEDFAFGTLPEDWEHFEPAMEKALHRVPALGRVGVQLFFNGPESFTPDDRYLLGEAPGLKGFFVACGFNSIGIQSAGGAGWVLADWIANGHPPMDLWDVDIRRMMPFQAERKYLKDRVTEGLGLLYAMHWPFRQVESARAVRRSPLHDRLAAAGACFGEAQGWERANWFAPAGEEPAYRYSYGRQNWFPYSAAEHRAVREDVGLFDQTSFSKYLVQGRDAEAVLNRICAGDVAVPEGRVVYTQWLNERGGIEADVTVTRLAGDSFLIVSGVTGQVRDMAWLRRHIPAEARCVTTDVTSAYAVLGIMGPRSREVLQPLVDADLFNAAFPFGHSREVGIGYARVRASRITYVGELGWELYVPTEFALTVYDTLAAAGIAHCGYHAMNSLRLEKGYRHWGHDITDEDTPLEAGLGFAVAWEKPDFIGRGALLRQRDSGVTRRLVQFALEDAAPLLYHNEPIWREGALVGDLASGWYGHTLGRAIGMGYVACPAGAPPEFFTAARYEIEVACARHAARASLVPWYDPKSVRVRA